MWGRLCMMRVQDWREDTNVHVRVRVRLRLRLRVGLGARPLYSASDGTLAAGITYTMCRAAPWSHSKYSHSKHSHSKRGHSK